MGLRIFKLLEMRCKKLGDRMIFEVNIKTVRLYKLVLPAYKNSRILG